MRIYRTTPLASSVAVAALFLGACSGDPTTPANSPENSSVRIVVADNSFSPMSATVNVGEPIVWEWTGSNEHTVQFEKLAINSGSAKSSGTFETTLTAQGSFTYHCTVHGQSVMSGTISVSSGSSTTGGGSGTGGDTGTGMGYAPIVSPI